jgi:hypothetical protein
VVGFRSSRACDRSSLLSLAVRGGGPGSVCNGPVRVACWAFCLLSSRLLVAGGHQWVASRLAYLCADDVWAQQDVSLGPKESVTRSSVRHDGDGR